ncbi:MAG TPA: type II CAAX endopeptidase family protein [Terracidiphilus sp.]|nr:type II CAAX endopeptidase family protein [Terracidiphilus sp.]
MSDRSILGGRLHACFAFLTAVVYFFAARSVARHSAAGLVNSNWFPLVAQAMLVFLLLFGFAGFGILFDRQKNPIGEQGLALRQGWPREAGLGVAVGWGLALVCALILALLGGIAIVLNPQPTAWGWLLADAAFFTLAALAEEMAFRGYAFQRFVHAAGPLGAALGFAVLYAALEAFRPGSCRASVAVSVVFSLLLSLAYLRTRALWVSWGINFGWKASRALLFGLLISGVSSHSSVIEGDPMGPFWLTGGGYGLDASWLAFALLLLAIPVVYRLTRDLDFKYNAPTIVPAGIPVDLDAAASRQHEQAMRPETPSPPPLVQIAPAARAAVSATPGKPASGTSNPGQSA